MKIKLPRPANDNYKGIEKIAQDMLAKTNWVDLEVTP